MWRVARFSEPPSVLAAPFVTLEHTFAKLMFENREQLKLVSEMLGHASIKETPPRGPPAGGAVAKLP